MPKISSASTASTSLLSLSVTLSEAHVDAPIRRSIQHSTPCTSLLKAREKRTVDIAHCGRVRRYRNRAADQYEVASTSKWKWSSSEWPRVVIILLMWAVCKHFSRQNSWILSATFAVLIPGQDLLTSPDFHIRAIGDVLEDAAHVLGPMRYAHDVGVHGEAENP